MKTTLITFGLIILLLIGAAGCAGCYSVSIYNNMVTKSEGVTQSWAQVENQYQRRIDLIPNLVEVVKGYATHEKTVFIEVTQARASVGQMKMNITKEVLDDPQAFKKYQVAQDGLAGALSKLMVIQEQYPNLKANENFMALQSQLEGTENRITVARNSYNITTQDYNQYIKVFPHNFIAGFGNFKEKVYFAAEEGAEKAPKIKF
jgi:LemA protein